ncbi:MAG TPA: HAMP domain-containing sensor histidine kinase [Candidatus Angelobacter sp.]|jgi:signal transduction histidine kinase|nr:HAMP domain-containing sensor histidine kinase [Candidatus Angelobacter sp.]
MAGNLADTLTSRGDRTIALWIADPDGPPPEQAPRLYAAVLQALVEGTDGALLRAVGLSHDTPDEDVAPILDDGLRRLQALARAVEHDNTQAPTADGGDLRADLVAVQRRLATATAALLGARAAELRTGLAAKSAALGVTVHELRRPLTILSSYAELLSDGTLGALTDASLTGVQGIASATDVLARLIEALAEVARLEDPEDRSELQPLTTGDLIDDAIAEIIGEAQLRGVGIEVTANPELPLLGDRRRLGLALVNLLSNAIKHAPAASTISITCAQDGGEVRLVVADRGPGFPPREAARLFEKYYRSVVERESGIPGTGLGLFIVKTVVERHGGRVEARLRPGGGAEFEVRLPPAPVRATAEHQAETAAAQ